MGWCDMNQLPATLDKKNFEDAVTDDSMLEDLSLRVIQAMNGEKIDFEDIPTPQGTDFQVACWNAARLIPHAHTRTYSQLATLAATPQAVRAAGQAMRANPIPIVIPCHRVVSAKGLGGFCGNHNHGRALAVKAALIRAESNHST